MNVVDAIGWTLLHFLWQGALIGVAYALLRTQVRAPQTRYALGLAALAACAVAPILTLCWLWPAQVAVGSIEGLPDWRAGGSVAGAIFTPHRIDVAMPWLVAAWCFGVTALGARTFWQWSLLIRARRTAIPVEAWRESMAALAARIGIRRPIKLLATAAVRAPTLVGAFKPVILLPTALLLRLPPAQLELILAHELCHVRRWDYLVNLAQVALETLLFYHPAVHWLSARVRADRELCCDEAVVAVLHAPPVRYAQALAELAEAASHLAPAASGGVLVERIEVLLTVPRPQRTPEGAWLPLAGAAAALLLAVGLRQALQPVPPRHVATVVAPHSIPRAKIAPAPQGVAARPVEKEPPARVENSSNIVVAGRGTSRQAASDSNSHRAIAAVSKHAAMPSATTSKDSRKAVPSLQEPMQQIAAPDRIAAVVARSSKTKLDNAPQSATLSNPEATAPANAATSTPIATDAHTASTQPIIATATQIPAPVVKTDEPGDTTPAITSPRVIHFVSPVYPSALGDRAVRGRVDLQFKVAADGSVQDVTVSGGGNQEKLAQAAVAALRQWRFAPDSVRAGRVYRQSIDFDLSTGGNESCRILTGSHICRRDLDAETAGVTITSR